MADWNLGDLALCINNSKIFHSGGVSTGEGLIKGKVYGAVVSISVGSEWEDAPILLTFENDYAARRASRFIKVTPDEEDEFDLEVINAMKEQYVTV